MSFPRLTLGTTARFYLPLLLNVQLMSVSHTIINGALARQPRAVIDLAAFGVALALHLFVASVAFQNHTIALTRARDLRSLAQVGLYAGLLALAVMTLLGLLAHTGLGDWVFGALMGVSPAVAQSAKSVLAVTMYLPFFTGLRGVAQGLLIQQRRTLPISLATLIRIGALILLLALTEGIVPGAGRGAICLLGCIAIEAAFTASFAARSWLPEAGVPPLPLGALLRFGLPLALSSGLQLSVPLLISAILGRLPDAALALAGFGVLRGFLFLIGGPQRNQQQSYLALVHRRGDGLVLLRFNLLAGGLLALLMLLIAGPLSGPVLATAMGLPPELQPTLKLALLLSALFPVTTGLVYQLAGLLTRRGETLAISRAVLTKLLFLGILWGVILAGWQPALPGLLLGIGLFLCAQGVELAWLASRALPFSSPEPVV